MQLTERSRIVIEGIPDIDSESTSNTFLLAAVFIIFLIGIFVPIIAISSGITGPGSAIYVILSILLFIVVIVAKRWLFAGMTAATIVLATFNMGTPLTPYVGNNRIEFMPVDLFLVPFGLFLLIDNIDRSLGYWATMFAKLTLLFSSWALLTGMVAVIRGLPESGLLFGIEQFRYPLIISVSYFSVRKFSLRYVIQVLMMALSIHIIYVAIELYLTRSVGLPYIGSVPNVPEINMQPIHIGPYSLETGLYLGGFLGSSRALLAVLILVFPIAVFWSLQDSVSISAYIVSIGTPLVAVLSRSDTGIILITLLSFCLLLIIFMEKIVKILSFYHIIIATILYTIITIITVQRVLMLDRFASATIRLRQYSSAISYFSEYPLFGIGGQNYPLLTSVGSLSDLLGIHSHFLAYLAELGGIGFVIFVMTVSIPYFTSIKKFVHEGRNYLILGLLAMGMLGFHTYSSLTFVYPRPPVMLSFWFIAGASVASSTHNR